MNVEPHSKPVLNKMFFDIFFLALAFNGVNASIENIEKSNEINCSEENSIINVTPIKDVGEKEFPVHIKFCKNGKIDYNTFTLSEENCFTCQDSLMNNINQSTASQ